MLVDKRDLVDYAKEIELSKQIIDWVKSLKESQLYNLEIYLTKKYGFEYQESSLQEQQLSKWIIRDAKILYWIWDWETKKYFEEIQLTKFLEEKFKFKYYDSNSVDTCKAIIEAAKKLYEIWDKELKDLFEQLKITQFLEKKYDFKY